MKQSFEHPINQSQLSTKHSLIKFQHQSHILQHPFSQSQSLMFLSTSFQKIIKFSTFCHIIMVFDILPTNYKVLTFYQPITIRSSFYQQSQHAHFSINQSQSFQSFQELLSFRLLVSGRSPIGLVFDILSNHI